ncbi:flavoprotein [Kineosporia sp. R_H_3]|uniref:flavoprotein n=1 Tax=Kineosporia sp. R_H_3 TaxID=1961848 RepID=UPI001E48A224|nr:flavoprotein [Kineosporia sp. R_H_3]
MCGSPAARGVPEFVRGAQRSGWKVCVVPTPMGRQFVDATELEDLTGFPVRTAYKHPDEPDVLPAADAFVVAPATFNTVNKIANGITDTLAVGLICEAMGAGKPVVVAPAMNRALACAGPYARSIALLKADGARVVLTHTTTPGQGPTEQPTVAFPWSRVLEELPSLG